MTDGRRELGDQMGLLDVTETLVNKEDDFISYAGNAKCSAPVVVVPQVE